MTVMLTDAEHEALADRLARAVAAGRGIDPPSHSMDYGFEDAWRIRRKLVDRLIPAWGAPCGHKIGFTARAMQEMYGMSGPDFGILLERMLVPAGAPVQVSGMSDTRAEPELAFTLARPLEGPGVTVADALAACGSVRAAVEVIDSRVGAMRAGAVDSLADNAGAGWVVLGGREMDPAALDLSTLVLSMEVDGARQEAPARDVMGHPAAPLAWLANTLPELAGLGGALKAGDVVITGAPVRSVAVAAGLRLSAAFGPLGTIEVAFT